MPATRPYRPLICLIFDFDRTLGTDSIDAILGGWGMERETWRSEYADPLGENWDDIIKRGQALIDAGRAIGKPLTLKTLREAGRERVELYEGALAMPDRLREVARAIEPDVELEFHILSSGYAEMIDATGIMDAFDDLWASTFHFRDGDGEAVCVKRIISHPQKALYVEAIAQGVEVKGSNAPEQAGRDLDEHEMHAPFDQVVYVGDGASDLHTFGFLESQGGLAIAIDDDDVFDAAEEQRASQRVENLAPPDYAEGSELLTSLEHCVRACASRIALRKLGRGE